MELNYLYNLAYKREVNIAVIMELGIGSTINFFPYSGWHSGKSIEDGRGFKNLLKQLN